MTYFYKVLVGNLYAYREYIYSSLSALQIGQVVEVEYGKKLSYGICVACVCEEAHNLAIKPILKVFDYIVDDFVLQFALNACEYNLVSIGSIVQLILPVELNSPSLHLLYKDNGNIATLEELLKSGKKRSQIEKMATVSDFFNIDNVGKKTQELKGAELFPRALAEQCVDNSLNEPSNVLSNETKMHSIKDNTVQNKIDQSNMNQLNIGQFKIGRLNIAQERLLSQNEARNNFNQDVDQCNNQYNSDTQYAKQANLVHDDNTENDFTYNNTTEKNIAENNTTENNTNEKNRAKENAFENESNKDSYFSNNQNSDFIWKASNLHDISLTLDQKQAISKIANLSKVGVLCGSTGSGKTIVAIAGAFENIAEHLKSGGKILIITPEISLGKNWSKVILKYFNVHACFYNYQVSKLYKKSVFNWAISNQPGVVIGARSALFLPYKNLRMIVIDEEHSSSLKQERYPRYQARDMAILRANIQRMPCLLISATPSLETQYNTEIGKYEKITLSRTPIHGKAEYKFVKAEKFQLLAGEIVEQMNRAFENGQQVLLFLNRRGYAPYCICASCNRVLNCKGCDVPLIFYNNHSIVCHKCGYTASLPTKCPSCQENTTWKFYGIGVERLLEFTKNQFPNKAIEVVTSKTKEIDEYINGLNEGKIDCLIATQVLAQGHDFKNISLVVIVDGDMGLNSPDFRATERIYQLWQQLRGRSARHAVPGKFMVQAMNASNKFLNLFNCDDIYSLLLEERRQYNWPPFSRCAFIIVKSKNYKQANLYFQLPDFERIKDEAQKNGIEFYGPLHVGKQNFIHEWRFLVKVTRAKRIDNAMRLIINLLPKQSQIKFEYEVDPYTFG